MTVEENAATYRAWYETWNNRNWEGLISYITPDSELITEPPGQTLVGHEGWRQTWELWNSGFPGHRLSITGLVAGDRGVASEAVFEGIHDGPFMTPGGAIPATGKPVRPAYAAFADMEDGKVTRYRLFFDVLTLLQQLGVAPAGAEAEA